MILLLILSMFSFQTSTGRPMEGYLQMPSTSPKAVILYFHRYTEKGDAVKNWESIVTRGYAIAGFLNFPADEIVQKGNAAAVALRNNPDLQNKPIIAVGASMGALYATQWFAS